MRGHFVNVTFTPTAGAAAQGSYIQGTFNSAASGDIYGQNLNVVLGASATGSTGDIFLQNVSYSPNAAATTAVTNLYGYRVAALAAGASQTVTNTYGFHGNVASGTNKYNLYMAGTADNYLAGPLRLASSLRTAKVTVASAATPDIFNAAGNFIDYTGTTTATDFPAAPQAGMSVTLYCAAACAFTAGTIIIEGLPTGGTVTMAAGAIVTVYAITTTSFKLTYSLSGSFTITGTGFTVNPTGTAIYTVTNGQVSLYVPSLTGTSNATTFTLTGLPACISPTSVRRMYAVDAVDNGVAVYAMPYWDGAAIQLGNGHQGVAWTNSGTKTLSSGVVLSYSLD